MTKVAIYLAGGGARGAYQAGVLKAISHILQVRQTPFHIISGVSVGSINAGVLAEHADDFPYAVEKLEMLWSSLHCQQIYSSSNYELSKSVFRNLITIFMKHSQAGYLLDTEPLREYINKHVDFDRVTANIDKGIIDCWEVITHCYESNQTVSFYQHHNQAFNDWEYARHISQKAVLNAEHVMASSALPLFFPTIPHDGFHYGDGSMGLVAPLRGCIRFEVEKIMILGTRHMQTLADSESLRNGDIGFAHILGGMLNGLFLDNLDRDIEMVNRMNDIARLLTMWKKRQSPWRPIQTLHLRPSRDVGDLAQENYVTMPALLRYLLNALGAKNHSGDLLSFLLFEKEFAMPLIQLGYEDTMSRADDVIQFFQS